MTIEALASYFMKDLLFGEQYWYDGKLWDNSECEIGAKDASCTGYLIRPPIIKGWEPSRCKVGKNHFTVPVRISFCLSVPETKLGGDIR